MGVAEPDRGRPDEHTRFSLSASGFSEERNNGTQLTRNSSRGQDFSVAAQRFLPTLDAEVRVQAYLQRRHFRSTFSSVNAERTVETPALDQFDVPATAAGGSAVWSQALGDRHRLVGGVDARWVEGETNEFFLRSGDRFTRVRNAGGRQLFLGAFVEENWHRATPSKSSPADASITGGNTTACAPSASGRVGRCCGTRDSRSRTGLHQMAGSASPRSFPAARVCAGRPTPASACRL